MVRPAQIQIRYLLNFSSSPFKYSAITRTPIKQKFDNIFLFFRNDLSISIENSFGFSLAFFFSEPVREKIYVK